MGVIVNLYLNIICLEISMFTLINAIKSQEFKLNTFADPRVVILSKIANQWMLSSILIVKYYLFHLNIFIKMNRSRVIVSIGQICQEFASHTLTNRFLKNRI